MEKQPHFSMIRGFHLADWFTIANAFCGMGAVLAVMAFLNGELPDGLLVAAALVPAAFVFDVFDGRVARWRQKQSALGRELDSLADVISFGVAPAALGFAFTHPSRERPPASEPSPGAKPEGIFAPA